MCRPGESLSKIQRMLKKKKRLVLGPSQRTKRSMKDESGGDTNCDWGSWNGLQKIRKGTGSVKNRRTNRDHPN